MHRRLIRDALESPAAKAIDFEKYATIWEKSQNITNDLQPSSEWKKTQIDLRKEITKLFDIEAENWKEKYENLKLSKTDLGQKGVAFLSSAGIVKVLKKEFPQHLFPDLLIDKEECPSQKQYIFDSFKGFVTYLSKYNLTRVNLYKDDGTSTAVATRVVENFCYFLQNIVKLRTMTSFPRFPLSIPLEKDQFQANKYCNFLVQEGINKYNLAIGEINKEIQKFRDKHQKEIGFKKANFPLLKRLNKQILGEVVKEEQLIKTNKDVFPRLREFINKIEITFSGLFELIDKLCKGKLTEEYEGIFIKKSAINTISRRWFENGLDFEMALPQKGAKSEEPKVKTFVSLKDISESLGRLDGSIFKESYQGIISDTHTRIEQFLTIFGYELNCLLSGEPSNQKNGFKNQLQSIKKLNLSTEFTKTSEQVSCIESFADTALKVHQMLKYFSLENKNQGDIPTNISAEFYDVYNKYFEVFDFIKYHSAFRNFLTKKPSDKEKIKINFESGVLLSGWDKNKETEKLGVILRRNSNYFLGVINKDNNKIFEDKFLPTEVSNDYYEKMEYRLFPDPKRMIPKIAFADCNKKAFGWTQHIQDIKNEYASYQESKRNRELWNRKFDTEKQTELIAYYQNCLDKGGYKNEFGFKWKDAESYSGIGEFNDDIERQNYKIKFKKISEQYINEKVSSGELYLFQIFSKDFSDYAYGRKNIHTLFFLNLFNNHENIRPTFRLGANAEVFFRERLTEKVVVDKKAIVTKNKVKISKKSGAPHHYQRYGEGKILLHFPIEINNSDIMDSANFNKFINTNILSRNTNDINIIGIDRGEKHLAYYSIINRRGEILDQGSLNEIDGRNYYNLLLQREKERLQNRQSWQTINQIKDLKKGYISQVIHKIAKLAVEHNAIIVLEDLNMRFKQIRRRVERSVYQQLEKALIDKLGYLVFKDRDPNAPGGVLNGYQLTAPFTSFEAINKQTGIIFYTQASYTSVTDPLTGFRKNIYISNSASKEKIKEEINKFEEIGWDERSQSYFFRYKTQSFSQSKNVFADEYTVYANVPRIKKQKVNGFWITNRVNPNEMLKELLSTFEFEDIKGDILKQIRAKEANNDFNERRVFDGEARNFYQCLVYILNLILQIRNSTSEQFKLVNDKIEKKGESIDFIASPVYPFFATYGAGIKENMREFKERFICGADLAEKLIGEYNGDANGAYNIARKGIIILNRIAANPKNPNLNISNNEWDGFARSFGWKTSSPFLV